MSRNQRLPAKPPQNVSCLAVIGLVLGGGLLISPTILGAFLNQEGYNPDVARRSRVASLNRVQHAYFLEKERLAPRIDLLGLGFGEIGPPTKLENKSGSVYFLHHTEQAVFHYAMPIDKGQSAVGAVFIIPSKAKSLKSSAAKSNKIGMNADLSLQSIVCFTTKSSPSPPPPPVLKGDKPVCAEGTTKGSS
ncbi:hypothetical protein [Pantanalinema sp. GBBB05]|uniref:hypothetical protein n=1 Tax=Pantanalinema sp. GBBB05 TaxID=2604139 RepID=UPI001DCC0C5F|nr:hypothetical protein [Pantanalinema sp. GBBB05]